MYPDLFEIPGLGFTLHSYGVAIMAAFVAAAWLSSKRAEAVGVSKDLVMDLGILGMVTGILGAKINYVLQYDTTLGGGTPPLFMLSDGKLSIWGALVGGAAPYAAWLLYSMRHRKGMNGITFVILAILTAIFAVAGSRAAYVWGAAPGEFPDNVWDPVTKNWRVGFVLYGGLIAGVISGALYIKWKGESIRRLADLCAPGMVLAIGIGRLGCFMQGCCYGRHTELPWAVSFPGGVEHVHPTQLYEFLVTAATAVFLVLWGRTRRREGEVFLMGAVCYAAWRFVVENLRDDPRPGWEGLTYSQWVSVGIFAGGLIGMVALRQWGNEADSPKSQVQ